MESRKRVAVIGAGCAGLVALKTCLEFGFDAVCLEKSEDIGGLWRYKPEEVEDESSVMKNTVTNTSKEMMAFSDFPPPADFPNYLPNAQYLEYLRMYADNFDLLSHIRVNTKVLSVDRTDDYNVTGHWKVTTKNMKIDETVEEIFDAVMCCTGHYVDPYIPPIKGLQDFKYGKVIHCRNYKDFHGYEDKKVIVVGMGNSGCDVAVELTQVASKVFLATNHGNWVVSRLTDYGYPTDLTLANRYEKTKAKYFTNYASAQKEDRLNKYFDHSKYGIKPNYHAYQQISVVNEYLPHRLISGGITMKTALREVFPDGRVIFEDGSFEENIDTIIFSTGYSFSFPYIESRNLLPVVENRVKLYKHMFCPNLAHPETLAIIGFVQPGGSHIVTAELQSRVTCELLSPDTKYRLPNRSEMHQDIDLRLEEKRHLFGEVGRHTIVENYMEYLDQLADLINVKPDPIEYLVQDPQLAYKLFFGPYLPYQFRLKGRKPWIGAREAIMTVWDRSWYPTRNRIGTANKIEKCSCPEENGCLIKKSVVTVYSIYALVFLILILFLAVLF